MEQTVERQERRTVFRTHVDRRLRNQPRIFLVILAVMLVLDVIRMIGGGVNPVWAIGAFVAGLALGYVLSRTKVLGWNASAQAVTTSTTIAGAIILILYAVFILFKNKLVSEVFHDPSVVGLSLTAGAMFGNISFTLRGIGRVLRLAASGTDGTDQSPSSNATSST